MTSAVNRPLCVIPARGNSKRFPRKNIAMLAGKPLVAHSIHSAKKSNVFDRICVSSEDDEVLEIAGQYGADELIKRPEELAADKAQVKDVCRYLLNYFEEKGARFSEFAVLLPTSPFRKARDIEKAYTTFKKEDANYLMSLVPYSHPPQRAVWAPENYVQPYFGIENMKQTQLIEELYRHDGSIIFAKSEAFLKENEFYGSKVLPYYIPLEDSVDIDHKIDLEWAEFLLSRNPQLLEQ